MRKRKYSDSFDDKETKDKKKHRPKNTSINIPSAEESIERTINAIEKLYSKNMHEIILSSTSIFMSSEDVKKKFIKFSNYKIFNLAIQYKDITLIEKMLGEADERTKFLVACHDNYILIHRLINILSDNIKNNQYNSQTSQKLLKAFVNIKPHYLIKVIIEAIDQTTESQENKKDKLNYILQDFQIVLKELNLDMESEKTNSFVNRVQHKSKEQSLKFNI